MRILFLSLWFPYPPNNGSKIRIYNLLRGLAAHHAVTLVCFTTGKTEDPIPDALSALCQEIHVLPWREYNPRGLRAILGYFNSKPRFVVDTFSREMQALIKQLLSDGKYGLVIASEMGMAGYASACQGTSALLDDIEHGSFYQRYMDEQALLPRLRNWLTWLKQKRYTAGLLHNFKAVTVVSKPERELLRIVAPGFKTAEILPNCIDLSNYVGSNEQVEPGSLVFPGSLKFAPNVQAMRWFLDLVYPQIRKEIPDVRLAITGDASGVTLPTVDGVTLTGFLEDIRPLISASWASLAPILSGGGTRLKILESMALKTPVVATSKGAEGLDVHHGKDILIADTPDAFAQAVIVLLKDPAMRQDLSANAYRLVQEKYDWAVTMPRFLQLVESTATMV